MGSAAELALFRAINQTWTNPVFDALIPMLGNKRFFLWTAAILAARAAWLLRGRMIAPALAVMAALACSDALNESVRMLVRRLRPALAGVGPRLLENSTGSFSFPSAHAANSFAMAMVLAWWLRRRPMLAAVFPLWALGTAYSRVYAGAHFPLDVACGAALGIVCGAAVVGAFEPWRRSRAEVVPAAREAGLFDTLTLILILLSTAFRIRWASNPENGLSPEETQYWDWSRRLDWSYFSKPPGIALINAATTGLFGSTALAVRSGAIACGLGLGAFTWLFVRRATGSARLAFLTLAALNILPLFAVGTVLMTTDAPLMLGWAAALWLYYEALFRRRAWAWAWPAAGAAVAFGMLGKYAMVFLPLSLLGYLIASPGRRRALRAPGLWLSIAMGAAAFTPVVYWNWRHDWVGFGHLAAQAGVAKGFELRPKWAANFVGSQVAVIGPAVFAAMIVVAWSVSRRKRAASAPAHDLRSYLLWMSMPVFVIYLAKSFQHKVQGNWAAPAYLAWTILVVIEADRWVRDARKLQERAIFGRRLALCVAGVALSAVIAAAAFSSADARAFGRRFGIKVPAANDPTKVMRGWRSLGNAVGAAADSLTSASAAGGAPGRGVFIVTEDYQLTAELAFHAPGQPTTYFVNVGGRRLNQYDFWPGPEDRIGQDAVFVQFGDREKVPKLVRSAFDAVGETTVVEGRHRGEVYQTFRVTPCRGFRGFPVQPGGAHHQPTSRGLLP